MCQTQRELRLSICVKGRGVREVKTPRGIRQEPERSSKNKRKTINRMRLKKKYTKKRASERFK